MLSGRVGQLDGVAGEGEFAALGMVDSDNHLAFDEVGGRCGCPRR